MLLMKNHLRVIGFIFIIATVLVAGATLKVCPVAAQQKDEATELFLVAQKAFEDGFYDVAIRYINQLLTNYPDTKKRIQAKLLLGQCYFFKSQYLQAYDQFQSLLPHSEFKDATLYWLGETLLKGTDYKQAIAQYEKLIELYPQSIYTAQAYYSLGWTYFEQERYQKAVAAYQKLEKNFPENQLNEDAGFKIGESFYNLEQYDDAISHFRNYLKRYPNSARKAEAEFYTAEAYYYDEQYDKAIDHYQKTDELAYNTKLSLMAKVSLGWCYLKTGQYDKSIRYFNEAQLLSESKGLVSDDVYLGQASLYAELNQNEKALYFYSLLIDKFPDSERIAEAYLGLANTHYLLKDYNKAITTYRTLINKLTQDTEQLDIFEKAYFGLAWSYLKVGQIDLSIRTFQEIKDLADNDIVKVSALTQIGDAYQDINRLQAAIDIYDDILQNYADSTYIDYVQYRQGIALLKMGKIEAATLSFLSLQSNFPESKYLKDIQYYLAVAYFKQKDWKAAKDEVQAFIKNLPLDNEFLPEAHHILALSHFNLDEYKEAYRVFKKIIKNFPHEETMVKNANLSLAKCLYEMGKVNASIEKLEELITSYPESEVSQEALLWIAEHYLETSDFRKAIDHYVKFLENFPGSDRVNLVYFELGQAYEALEEYDKAITYYNKIQEDNQKNLIGKAKLSIANIFAKKFEPERAIRTYQNIIETTPSFRRKAYVKLAEVYVIQKQYQKSLSAFQKALQSDIGNSHIRNAQIQFLIADNYELLNESQKAVESYLKIPYLYEKDIDWIIKSYLRIGRIFEDQEKWNEAKTIYQKIRHYETDMSKFANERIEWIENNIQR
jgi:tetratricopeptide (TPR) repeat protein